MPNKQVHLLPLSKNKFENVKELGKNMHVYLHLRSRTVREKIIFFCELHKKNKKCDAKRL
jgi:hypothetical protein